MRHFSSSSHQKGCDNIAKKAQVGSSEIRTDSVSAGTKWNHKGDKGFRAGDAYAYGLKPLVILTHYATDPEMMKLFLVGGII